MIILKWLIPFWFWIFFGFFVSNVINIGNPFLLKEFIDWIEDEQAESKRGIIIFILITTIALIKPFFSVHAMRSGIRTSVAINIVFYGLYFKKFEEIRLNASRYLNIGKITNSLATDI